MPDARRRSRQRLSRPLSARRGGPHGGHRQCDRVEASLAADGDPGAHSPFATALLRNFSENPRLYFGDLLNKTATEVKLATAPKPRKTREKTLQRRQARPSLNPKVCHPQFGGEVADHEATAATPAATTTTARRRHDAYHRPCCQQEPVSGWWGLR